MTRSAFTFVQGSGALARLLLMAHPSRSPMSPLVNCVFCPNIYLGRTFSGLINCWL